MTDIRKKYPSFKWRVCKFRTWDLEDNLIVLFSLVSEYGRRGENRWWRNAVSFLFCDDYKLMRKTLLHSADILVKNFKEVRRWRKQNQY